MSQDDFLTNEKLSEEPKNEEKTVTCPYCHIGKVKPKTSRLHGDERGGKLGGRGVQVIVMMTSYVCDYCKLTYSDFPPEPKDVPGLPKRQS